MRQTIRRIPVEELDYIKNPGETPRLILALVVLLPFSVLFTFGAILYPLEFTLAIGSYLLLNWFVLSIAKAKIISNSLKVSDKNFPEVQQLIRDTKIALDYARNIDIYIVQENSINSFLAHFFSTRFIILNSELVEDMLDDHKRLQLKWVIGRFIGALKIKQIRLNVLTDIFERTEGLFLLNIFILPYTRATQFSGDNIGLSVCGDLKQAMIAFDKMLVGNDLSPRVRFEGIIDQGKEIKNSPFVLLARLFSPFPHTVNRYLNLLAFAKWRYPEQFYHYIQQFNIPTSTDLAQLLPSTYLGRELRGGMAQYRPPAGAPDIRHRGTASDSGGRIKIRIRRKNTSSAIRIKS